MARGVSDRGHRPIGVMAVGEGMALAADGLADPDKAPLRVISEGRGTGRVRHGGKTAYAEISAGCAVMAIGRRLRGHPAARAGMSGKPGEGGRHSVQTAVEQACGVSCAI